MDKENVVLLQEVMHSFRKDKKKKGASKTKDCSTMCFWQSRMEISFGNG